MSLASTSYFETPKESNQCDSSPDWTYVVIGIESVIIVVLIVWLVFRIQCKKKDQQYMIGGQDIRMKKTSMSNHQVENDYEEVILPNNDHVTLQPNADRSHIRESDARVDLILELQQAALPKYLPMSPIRRKISNV